MLNNFMKLKILWLSLILLFSINMFAQTKPATTKNLIKTSPAFAEVLLRKVEVEAELEALLLDYLDAFPKVQ